MKKRVKVFTLILMLSILQIVFSTSVLAAGNISVESAVEKSQMILKVTDDRIKVSKVEQVRVIVGKDVAANSTGIVNVSKTLEGSNNKVIEAHGTLYRISDGSIQMDISATSEIARMLGDSMVDLIIRVELTDKQIIDMSGKIKSVFISSSDTPSDGDDKDDKYLFLDYKYTSSDMENGGHWAYDNIKELKKLNIVRGTTEGYLFPNSYISLKEFIALLSRTIQHVNVAKDKKSENVYRVDSLKNPYDEWVVDDYSVLMNAYGIISGETKEKGKKELDKVLTSAENINSPVTREEAAIMIGALFGDCITVENPIDFKDWAKVNDKGRVSRLCEYGVMFGTKVDDELYVNPQTMLSRVEAMVLIGKIIELEDDILVKSESETKEKVTADDKTDPLITFVPNQGQLKPGSEITVNVVDEESKVTIVRYSWDGNVSTSQYSINKNKYSTKLKVPEKEGTHILRVWARNEGGASTGWHSVSYNITKDAENDGDQTPPVISAFVSGEEILDTKKINQGVEFITIKASDPESGIKEIEYYWNDEKPVIVNKDTVDIKVPFNKGKHILYVKATNNAGLVSSGELTLNKSNDGYNTDSTAPEVKIFAGSKEIGVFTLIEESAKTITIKASDPETGIKEIEYYWNYEKVPHKVQTDSVEVQLPTENGEYVLYIKVTNNAGLVSEGAFEYQRGFNNSNEKDKTAPEISINTSLREISVKDYINVTAKDNESGIERIIYYWDSNEDTEIMGSGLKELTVRLNDTPQTPGKHILNVKAINGQGITSKEVKFEFNIINSDKPILDGNPGDIENDTSAPSVNIDTNKSIVSKSDKINVSVYDNESGISKIIYRWDSNNEFVKTLNSENIVSTKIEISVPQTDGKHTLYVKAINGKNITSREISKEFTIGDYSYEKEDKNAPQISINTSKISISTKDVLKVTAKDAESGVYTIKYKWDNQSETVVDCRNAAEITIPVKVPEIAGEYDLFIEATDNIGNVANKKYTFNIEKKNKPTIDDIVIDYEKDSTPPEVRIDTTQEKISKSDRVSITALDNESGITQIVYRWDSEAEKVVNINALKVSLKLNVPQTVGKHYLYVKAQNGANNALWSQEVLKIFEITDSEKILVSEEVDSPIIVMIEGDEDDTIFNDGVTGNIVEPEVELIITGKKPDDIICIGYRWDNGNEELVEESEFKVKVPEEVGTHYLYVRIEYEKDGWTDERKYKFVVEEDLDDVDIEEVQVEIKDAKDDTVVFAQTYKWKDVKNENIVIKAPKVDGKYYLYAKVIDEKGNIFEAKKVKFEIEEEQDENSPNLVLKTKFRKSETVIQITRDGKEADEAGMVTYPGNPELIGLINPNVDSLRVEIRNADGKLMFEPNENIKYYIDFYNGSDKEITNVKITFTIQDGFKIESTTGDSTISNGKAVWDIGSVIKGGGNRFEVIVKYTKDVTEEIRFEPIVDISINNQIEDASYVYNVIFKQGSSSQGVHSNYIVGYPDGTFKPEGTITRAETAAMLAKLFDISSYSGSSFYDLDATFWANPAINACITEGLIDTYGNYFDPHTPATRSLFAIALARKLNVADKEPIFINSNDTSEHYARKEIENLIRLGLIKGYSDGSAGPNNLVTRAEAVTMLNKYSFRGGLKMNSYSNYGNVFIDVASGHWAINQIFEAALTHNYERTTNGEEISI